MADKQQAGGRIKVGLKQGLSMLFPYAKLRLLEQVKAVALIIIYLIFFQTMVLGIAVAQASMIAVGLALVVGGLAFFMEGLMLGLMPLGEVIGLKLPQKSKLPVILGFAFLLGIGATFAEPAISVLRAAGSSVRPWDAPLLFLMLNKYSSFLVISVGVGVGIAVMFGMIRFMYNISLKPFIYILISLLAAVTVFAFFSDNLRTITGLAWDCGAVTTGPVTVPLVLALGIGISRVLGSGGSGASGFGVVTLASLFPIVSVFTLGITLSGSVPEPMTEAEFFSKANQVQAQALFADENAMFGYGFSHAGEESQLAMFDGSRSEMLDYLRKVKADEALRAEVFGVDADSMEKWAATQGTKDQQLVVFPDEDAVRKAAEKYAGLLEDPVEPTEMVLRNIQAAVQAIVPLSIFFVLVLMLILRERLPRADEVFLGIGFAVIGMMLFGIGIEIGLSKLGNQVGGRVPSAFKSIELPEQRTTINRFDSGLVETAVTMEGEQVLFFYVQQGNEYSQLPYYEDRYDPATRQYVHTPTRGPLFGAEGGLSGIIVVLLFAFFLGYGATLAEPALNALGLTVEEITVGAFKKSLLMQAVALGVGVGIATGVAKIIWNIPLMWMLLPPYILLLVITKFSTEEFVNIGWDSAGVTTGPITVPLVLAMGLGIGGQVGVVEGFGILSMASVCPILSVLIVGLMVTRKRKAALAEAEREVEKGGAE